MKVDGEIEEMIKVIALEVRADLNDEKHLHWLLRAIEYADPGLFVSAPKSKDEKINTEIFKVKAVCYFSRKTLNPFKDLREIYRIRSHEHLSVSNLTSQLIAWKR